MNNISKEILEQYQDYINKRDKLKALAERPGTPHEGEVAGNLLRKIDSKIEEMEKTYNISREEISSTNTSDINSQRKNKSTTCVNNRGFGQQSYGPYNNYGSMSQMTEAESEEELLRKLGIIYVIFGTQYTVRFAGHKYTFYFKHKAADEDWAFYRVYSDIYEDDQNICYEVIIGFCPFYAGDTECGDMEISTDNNGEIKKYRDSCRRYKEILQFLQTRWNEYFSKNSNGLSVYNNPDLAQPKTLAKNRIW